MGNFPSQAATAAFMSSAVIAAAENLDSPPKPARHYELLAMVRIQTAMPLKLLRTLCEAFPSPEVLAMVVGNAITVAVEERQAAKGGAPC